MAEGQETSEKKGKALIYRNPITSSALSSGFKHPLRFLPGAACIYEPRRDGTCPSLIRKARPALLSGIGVAARTHTVSGGGVTSFPSRGGASSTPTLCSHAWTCLCCQAARTSHLFWTGLQLTKREEAPPRRALLGLRVGEAGWVGGRENAPPLSSREAWGPVTPACRGLLNTQTSLSLEGEGGGRV